MNSDATQHDIRLGAIRAWLERFPPDSVAVGIRGEPSGSGGTLVSIRPLRSPEASPIQIRIACDSGFVNLHAGQGFSLDDTYWPDMPVVKVLQAIADGNLVEEVRTLSGKDVGIRGWLHVDGETSPVYDNRSYDYTRDAARMVLKLVSGKTETRTIRYASYV